MSKTKTNNNPTPTHNPVPFDAGGTDWITVKAASELSGRSKSTIKNWIKAGILQTFGATDGTRTVSRSGLLELHTSHAPRQRRPAHEDEPIMEVSNNAAANKVDGAAASVTSDVEAANHAQQAPSLPHLTDETMAIPSVIEEAHQDLIPALEQTDEKAALNDISFDEGTQLRQRLNEKVVDDYAAKMKCGNKFPPVMLFRGDDVLFIGDGWHRLRAAKKNSYQHFPAYIHEGGKVAAIRHALAANISHGLPLTNADKRKKVQVALSTYPSVSSNEIAKVCGVSESLVRTIRDRFVKNEGDKRIGADGKTYPAQGRQRRQRLLKKTGVLKRTEKLIIKLDTDALLRLKALIEKRLQDLGNHNEPQDGHQS